ncbi:MAG: vitamin K epoxide reductase family protein [Propionibacteriaceae bacterium]
MSLPESPAPPPPDSVAEGEDAADQEGEVEPADDPAGDFVTPRTLGLVLLVAGLVGLVAAFVLAVEKFKLLSNPFYQPTCSISERFSCTSVMTSPQAEVFGFPNPLLGIAGFAVVAATGAVLTTGVRLPLWYWRAAQGGVLFGIGFVHWLMWQSVTSIGALCPYCMVVWAAMIVIFVYLTLHHLRISAPAGIRTSVGALARFHSTVVAAWLLMIAAGVIITSL